MSETTKVGIVGLGRMGCGIAKNIIEAGLETLVFDLDKQKTDAAVKLGALEASSPADMASQCTHIVFSLFGKESIDSVLFGKEGITSGTNLQGLTILDTTTIAPEESREFADKLKSLSIEYLDSPATGGEHGAETGALYLMVGGYQVAYDSCKPILDAISQRAVLVGDSGAGSVAKAVNQLFMIAQIAGSAECVSFTEKQGVDFTKVLSAINPELTGNVWMQRFNTRRETYYNDPSSRIPASECHYSSLFIKDLKCSLKMGEAMPFASAGLSMLETAVANATDGPFPWSCKSGLDKLQELGSSQD